MYKKIKTENIILIVLAIILIIIIAIIVNLNENQNSKVRKAVRNPSITSPTQKIPPLISPIEDISQTTNTQGIKWDEKSTKLMFNKVMDRKPLSANDEAARKKALNLLPFEDSFSGALYSSPKINIIYTTGNFDDWEVEILTIDIGSAKEEAVNWFKEQGFSQDFICNYPVEFYLNGEVAQNLSDSNIIFNPLPPNCQ